MLAHQQPVVDLVVGDGYRRPSCGGGGVHVPPMPVVEVKHPLVQHKLGLLRDIHTPTQLFRQLVNELTLLLAYEATKELLTEEVEVETPLERTPARRVSGKKVAVCPILRAGMGMLSGDRLLCCGVLWFRPYAQCG